MASMVVRIAEINALAEQSAGFIWRFKNPAGFDWLAPFADYFNPFEPERVFFNMSVWRSLEDLRRFVFATEHRGLLSRKKTWMLPSIRPHLVMWWIPSGDQPGV